MVNTAKNFLTTLNNLQQMYFFKRSNSKKAEATVELIANNITNKMTRVPKNTQQNNSETFTNDNDKEIHKKRYIA